jgi:hypothetical protein
MIEKTKLGDAVTSVRNQVNTSKTTDNDDGNQDLIGAN